MTDELTVEQKLKEGSILLGPAFDKLIEELDVIDQLATDSGIARKEADADAEYPYMSDAEMRGLGMSKRAMMIYKSQMHAPDFAQTEKAFQPPAQVGQVPSFVRPDANMVDLEAHSGFMAQATPPQQQHQPVQRQAPRGPLMQRQYNFNQPGASPERGGAGDYGYIEDFVNTFMGGTSK